MGEGLWFVGDSSNFSNGRFGVDGVSRLKHENNLASLGFFLVLVDLLSRLTIVVSFAL